MFPSGEGHLSVWKEGQVSVPSLAPQEVLRHPKVWEAPAWMSPERLGEEEWRCGEGNTPETWNSVLVWMESFYTDTVTNPDLG